MFKKDRRTGAFIVSSSKDYIASQLETKRFVESIKR